MSYLVPINDDLVDYPSRAAAFVAAYLESLRLNSAEIFVVADHDASFTVQAQGETQ